MALGNDSHNQELIGLIAEIFHLQHKPVFLNSELRFSADWKQILILVVALSNAVEQTF